MHDDLQSADNFFPAIRSLIGWLTFASFIAAMAAIIYFDDIQITATQYQETPTIYNVRIFGGIKIIDGISILLVILLTTYQFFNQTIAISPHHKYIVTIFLVYCYASMVGFIYSFFYRYDYQIWLQDFQQTIYMVGFYFLTFYILDTKAKWKIFIILFLSMLALKNMLILQSSLMGVGKAIGGWAFRASQNAEFAYFPMLFFPLLILMLHKASLTLKLLLGMILLVYLFNSLIGIYRTVWVMLMVGLFYLIIKLEADKRILLILSGILVLALILFVIEQLFPKFLSLAWNYKFASIFEWSVEGDRSNATRRLELVNVTSHVFKNFAFLHGMGLGAWWDDSARRLLPDLGSGFTYKTRYYNTHMWWLTQFLKLGLIPLIIYWLSVYKMFHSIEMFVKKMSWDNWEKSVLMGLNIGLLCSFVSSADFVRLFLMIGVNLGISTSYIYLNIQAAPSENRFSA